MNMKRIDAGKEPRSGSMMMRDGVMELVDGDMGLIDVVAVLIDGIVELREGVALDLDGNSEGRDGYGELNDDVVVLVDGNMEDVKSLVEGCRRLVSKKNIYFRMENHHYEDNYTRRSKEIQDQARNFIGGENRGDENGCGGNLSD
jgi:hypothetical protein